MQDIQFLFSSLLSKEEKERAAAEMRLIALEQDKKLTALQLVSYLPTYKNHLPVLVYIIEAVLRLGYSNQNNLGFKEINQFMQSTDQLLLWLVFLNSCLRLKKDSFIDLVSKTVFYQQSMTSKVYNNLLAALKLGPPANDQAAMKAKALADEILIPGLKYLQLFYDPNVAKRIIKFINHKNDLARYYAILYYFKHDLHIDNSILEDILNNDSNKQNRDLAKIFLEKLNKDEFDSTK